MSLKLKKGVNKQSAYNLRDPNLDYEAAHTLSIIVDNESGVPSMLLLGRLTRSECTIPRKEM